MEIKYHKDKIEFEKELNSLDKFVIDFCSILNKLNIKYVIIAGYVAILFGRNRNSEDVDIFIDDIDLNKFKTLWMRLLEEFECVNTNDVHDAFENYLQEVNQIRFSRKNHPVPNMEIKKAKDSTDWWSLNNRKKVILNNSELFISPFEMQIAYKLYLGSEKDIEDARFLYKLFKERIDIKLLHSFNSKFNIEERFRRYIYGTT